MSKNANKNYRRIRSQLIHRGLTLRRWAEMRAYPASTVYDAARGTRSGVTAVRIRRELEEYING